MNKFDTITYLTMDVFETVAARNLCSRMLKKHALER